LVCLFYIRTILSHILPNQNQNSNPKSELLPAHQLKWQNIRKNLRLLRRFNDIRNVFRLRQDA
jgi:hypothetical protein